MMAPRYNTGQPLYRQVADELDARVRRVYYADGRLPPEHSLAREFEVSVITIKQALNILVNDNLIYRRARKGTFVRPKLFTAKTPASRSGIVRWFKFMDLNLPDADAWLGDVLRRDFPNTRLEIIPPPCNDWEDDACYNALDEADVFTLNSRWLKQLMAEDRLLALDHGNTGLERNDYFKASLAPALKGNQLFAWPRMMNVTALYCNRTVFAESGLELPAKRMPWSELLNHLNRLPKYRQGQKLWPMGYARYPMLWWENFLWQKGANGLNGRGRSDLDSAAAHDGLRIMRTIMDPGRARDLTRDCREFFTRHGGSNLACFIFGPFAMQWLKAVPDQWCILPLPTCGLPTAGAASYYVGINRRSGNVNAALDFLRLICGPAGQDLLCRYSSAMPAHMETARTAFVRSARPFQAECFPEAAREVRMAPDWIYDPAIQKIMFQQMGQALAGKVDLKTVCRQTVRLLNTFGNVLPLQNPSKGI